MKRFLGLVLPALFLLAGCRDFQAGHPVPPTAVPAAAAAEQDVAPEINKEFLTPDLNPKQWVERFEKEGREVYDKRLDIVGALHLRPKMNVADIGAGTGLFTLLFAENVRKGTVYAVDIAPKFLDLIHQRAQQAHLANVKTVLATERSVELPARSIDLAYVCDVYHHFEYPKSSLASIRTALRPGGSLVLVDFKRVPGQSSDWILKHVRAGEEVFTREIEEAGFEKVEEYGFLRDTYMIRFRKR